MIKKEPTQERPDVTSLLDQIQEIDDPSEMDKIFERLLNEDNLLHLTQFSKSEINAFTTLGSIATKYELDILEAWLKDHKKHRVSLDRKGRLEFVKISQRNPDFQEMPGRRPFWASFRRE